MALANAGWAIPTLQLDIPNGVYNTVDETTYATTPNFTLRALLNSTSYSGTYYISAAIVPNLGPSSPPPNVGSFTINGTTYTTANMTWGTPPINVADNLNGGGPGNLGAHDVFPTYYLELAFNFDATHTVGAYNTADGTTSPGSLFYHDFSIAVGNLLPGYALHFDLYDERIKSGNWTLDDFAPFSHDAQSGAVPDGGLTLAMLGFGLTGLGALRRTFSRA